MKTVVTPAILALVLLAAGGVCWTLGGAQDRIAHADVQLATMEFGAAAEDAGELDRSLSTAARVPIAGAALTSDADTVRETAAYWLRRYQELTLARDAGGALVERDPHRLLLGANAVYRATRIDPADRTGTVERLASVVENYADVLKSGGPDDVLREAAYNYEVAARTRSALDAPPARVAAPAPATAIAASIHGQNGSAPKAVPSKSFKVVVPKRGDERENNPEAGQGQQKVRRG